jgi:hypothetical protein
LIGEIGGWRGEVILMKWGFGWRFFWGSGVSAGGLRLFEDMRLRRLVVDWEIVGWQGEG